MPQYGLVALANRLIGTSIPKQAAVDSTGAAIIAAPAVAQYYAPAKAGAVGLGGNQSGATLSAGLATTYTGLVLSNPAGSGVNLSVIRVSGSINVAPAALTGIGLIVGFAAGGITVHTTPVTPQNGLIGAAAPALVAKLDAAATLVGTPAWADWLSETPAATSVLSFSRAYDGQLLIPPGGYVAIGATIAGPTAGLLGAFVWQEVAQ